MVLNKIHTNENDADMFSKVIPGGKFNLCTCLAELNSKQHDKEWRFSLG